MAKKPNKWVALLLGLIATPLSFLYVAKPRLAVITLALLIASGLLRLVLGEDSEIAIAFLLFYVIAVIGLAIWLYKLAVQYDENSDETKPRPLYSRWFSLIAFAAAYMLAAVMLRSFFMEPFRAPSSSMEPTIPARSHIIVSKWGYGNYGTYGMHFFRKPISNKMMRSDMVVFEYPPNPSQTYIKRLIGLPGDVVSYQLKTLSINGVVVPTSVKEKIIFANQNDVETTEQTVAETLDGTTYDVLKISFRLAVNKSSVQNFPHRENCIYTDNSFSCTVPAGNYFVMGDNRDNSNDSRYWGFVPAEAMVGKVVKVFRH